MGPASMALAASGCAAGFAAVSCGAYRYGLKLKSTRLREVALSAQGASDRREGATADPQKLALRYARSLSRGLFTQSVAPLSPSVRAKRAGDTRAGARYRQQASLAGCSHDITVSGFCEARLRLALAGCLAGALLGLVFTVELSFVLAAAGAVAGAALLPHAVADLRRTRGICAEQHLSEMLEVVALGLRSGLTFDRSFALYGTHFDNELAHACALAYRKWSLGLSSRDDALHELSASFDCPQLSRIVDGALRSLRFGSSLTGMLEEGASQSRAACRAALEERVAKAPVKMMLPTGALILPAMLLLVMGPILLELAGGF